MPQLICIFASKVYKMKIKRFTIEDVYFKMMEEEFKHNQVVSEQSLFVYFASYYITRFLHTDLNLKAYIGLKLKDLTRDFFVITVPFSALQKKYNRYFFKKYFKEGLKENERYIGLIKNSTHLSFVLKHDEELLNAFKTGQYSKISELKKNKMKRLKVIDYDMKVKAFYLVGNENNTDDWKNYPLGKKDKLIYELYKMIYPHYFYHVLSEQFNVSIEYLKKNHVEILPPPNLETAYLEITEKDDVYWFEKK